MKFRECDDGVLADVLGLELADAALLRIVAEAGPDARLSDIHARVANAKLGFASRQQVIRRVGSLVARGFVVRTSAGPQTRYALDERVNALAWLRADYTRRPRRDFDYAAMEAYTPNETHLLSMAQCARLRECSDAAIEPGATLGPIVFHRFMIDFSWASSRMEGNTYSLLETRDLLDKGEEANEKTHAEAQMLRNHACAMDYLIAHGRDLRLSATEIRGLHAMLSRGLLGNAENEGALRHSIVEIGRSAYMPSSVPILLEQGLRLIVEKAREIDNLFEKSFYLMAEISYLQPFVDVNKRVGRIAANLPLFQHGLCPLSFHGMEQAGYINGLLAWYELRSPVLLADAYLKGYEVSAMRMGKYAATLEGTVAGADTDNDDRDRRDALLRAVVKAAASGEIEMNEALSFLRKRLPDELVPATRDRLCAQILRDLSSLDSARVMALGIAPRIFADFERIKERSGHGHGDPSPGRPR